MTERAGETQGIAEVVAQLQDRLAANASFTETFECPVPKGAPEPCLPDSDGVPLIDAPFGRVVCPVMERQRCMPFQSMCDHQEFEASERWLRWSATARIPKVLRGASLKHADASLAVQRARKYVDEEYPRGLALVLSGPTGVGKTWAAIGAMREIFAKDPSLPAFFFFPSWVGAILTPELRDAALATAKNSHLVVLDDCGREYLKPGGMADAKIDELIFEREGNRRPTIITTNLSVEEMRGRMSQPTWDRIRGWAKWFDITGKSRRSSP